MLAVWLLRTEEFMNIRRLSPLPEGRNSTVSCWDFLQYIKIFTISSTTIYFFPFLWADGENCSCRSSGVRSARAPLISTPLLHNAHTSNKQTQKKEEEEGGGRKLFIEVERAWKRAGQKEKREIQRGRYKEKLERATDERIIARKCVHQRNSDSTCQLWTTYPSAHLHFTSTPHFCNMRYLLSSPIPMYQTPRNVDEKEEDREKRSGGDMW